MRHNNEKLSLRAYAEHRGCDPKTVRQALAAGRIHGEKRGHSWLIDPVAADRQWADRTHPGPRGRKPNGTPPGAGTNPPPADEINDSAPYAKSAAREKFYKAELAKIELKIQTGELVDKAEVERNNFTTFRILRDNILNVPDRLAAILANETDRHKVHMALSNELKKALRQTADALHAIDSANNS
ncbi:MAG TPA: hypothetical protein PK231_04700 [Acidocella sp.]|nr:hypothetical protein [Acidocella sp.]